MSDFRHSPAGGAFVRICGEVETVLGFVASHLLAVGAFHHSGAFYPKHPTGCGDQFIAYHRFDGSNEKVCLHEFIVFVFGWGCVWERITYA